MKCYFIVKENLKREKDMKSENHYVCKVSGCLSLG